MEATSTTPGTVVMLSGPVGAGKTTVARQLIPLWPRPLSFIEGDTFWSFLAKPKSTEHRENFRIILRAMTAAALPFARSGYDVLLDFSIAPGFLKTARAILKEIPLDFVLLKPSQAICEARALGRTEGKIIDYGPYGDFYSIFDYEPRLTIAGEAEPAITAERILEGLSTGLFRVQ